MLQLVRCQLKTHGTIMLKVSTVTSSTLSIESIQDNHAKSIHMLQVVHCQLKNTRDNPAKSIHMLQLVHCQKHT